MTARGAFSARAAAGIVVFLAIVAAVVAIALHDPTGERGNRLPRDFAYETKDLRPIAPDLIGYAERAAFDAGLAAPRALAVDAHDNLYVAGDRAVAMFGPQGTPAGARTLQGEPTCLAVTADGAWYVGMNDHVEVFDAAGTRTAAWAPHGTQSFVTAVAAIPEGIVVADAGERIVLLYGTDGALVRPIGARNPERTIAGFVVPSPFLDAAMGKDGLLRVTNPGRHKVEAYSLEGDLCLAWGAAKATVDGFCGCCNPVHIAVLPDGAVVTSEKGLVTVKVCEPDGALRCVVAGPDRLGENALGYDVAVDSKGRIIVLDPVAKKVRVFQPAARRGSPRSETGSTNG
ncbi:MAG TPA: hypothetical protein DCM87_16230 [Planctomycetes bacterium]|nr:hypothetical protein [Planctomycetota bacterium]